MMQSEQIDQLATALSGTQSEVKNAKINRQNPHFKNRYADLASVRDAVSASLAKHGLAVTQTMHSGENFTLRTTLMHKSGQWIASDYPLPVGAKPQELGSALTYARRYSLSSIVGIAADEDDDAEGAEKHVASLKMTQAQVDELVALADEVGANKPAFCKYMKAPSIADIPSTRFSEAKAALEAKRSQP